MRTVGAALVALAVLAAAPAPAHAEPDDPMTVQMRLIAAADRIGAVIAEEADGTGLAGITVETDLGQLWLYWKGEVPDRVRRAVAAEWPAVEVAVRPARHSADELLAAGAAILPTDGVTGIGPRPDGSALVVSVETDAATAWTWPAIQQAPVPIVVEPFTRPIPAVGRQQDTAPYSGGSIYHFPLPDGFTGVCTTGFAVRVGQQTRMLSAGHCGDDGDTVYEGNGSGPAVAMGTVTGTDKGRDTLLIGAAAQGRIYDGPFASMSSRPIHTVIGNWPKTLVCTSGAVTGQHCDLRIVSVNQVVKVGTQLFTGLVRAEQIDHEVGAGTGDSGGPVVARDAVPSGFVNVYPLGTISLIADNAPCGPTLMPARCGWIVWYADVNDALARYSATIVK